MAAPPRLQTLSAESTPDLESLVQQLSGFTSETAFALTKRLTFSENFQAELKDVSFVAPAPVWTAPTFENSWVDFGSVYQTAAYRIQEGRVYLRGLIKSGTITTAAFTLPAGYWPAAAVYQIVVSNNAVGVVDVRANGQVIAQVGNNTHFSLDGVTFDAASPCALPILSGTPVVTVKHALQSVSAALPVYCRAEGSSSARASGVPDIEWEPADKAIRIKTVTGLTPGVRYTMRILMVAR
jgi:hypothetical protein